MEAILFEYHCKPADTVIDCRVDLVVPAANFTGTLMLAVEKANLPTPFSIADLADACTALIDQTGLTVTF